MIIYKRCTCNDDFWEWYSKTDTSVFYGYQSGDVSTGSFASDVDSPPDTPEELINQKRQRIAKVQIEQCNDRIKQWEDKRKRFK